MMKGVRGGGPEGGTCSFHSRGGKGGGGGAVVIVAGVCVSHFLYPGFLRCSACLFPVQLGISSPSPRPSLSSCSTNPLRAVKKNGRSAAAVTKWRARAGRRRANEWLCSPPPPPRRVLVRSPTFDTKELEPPLRSRSLAPLPRSCNGRDGGSEGA